MPPETNSQFPNSTPPISPSTSKSKREFVLLLILGLILIAINLCFVYKTYFSNTEVVEDEQNLVVDDISDWKTYRNEEYGFEFKYPATWKISQDLENIEKKENEGHLPFKDLSLYVLDSKKELDYINFVKNYDGIGSGLSVVGYEGDLVNIFILNKRFSSESLSDLEEKLEDRSDGFWIENVKDVSIGDFESKRFISRQEYEGSLTKDTVKIEKPDTGNGFINLTIHYNNSNYRKDVFDQILSTFKFISTSTPVTTKLKVCPDEWIQNNMPTVGESNEERQYYILNGERKEIAEFDASWVGQNCNLEKQIVY